MNWRPCRSKSAAKQTIALLATGVYMAGAGNKSGGLDMGAALNSVLQKQIANVAGSALKTVNISFGMENYDGADAGGNVQITISVMPSGSSITVCRL